MMPARFHNSATVYALKSFQMSADENRFMSNTRVERVWRFHCWCIVPHFCLMLYYPVTPPNTKILYNFSITFAGNRDSCHICPFNMFCMQMVQYLNAGHVFQLVIYRWATTKKTVGLFMLEEEFCWYGFGPLVSTNQYKVILTDRLYPRLASRSAFSVGTLHYNRVH